MFRLKKIDAALLKILSGITKKRKKMFRVLRFVKKVTLAAFGDIRQSLSKIHFIH